MENHYFDADGVYTGSAPANLGTLPPSNAMRLAPPKLPGHWPVANTARNDWEMLEDHRGERGWLAGERCEMTALGSYPEGWTRIPPTLEHKPSVDELRQSDYRSEADGFRDRALSFQAEEEGWRMTGNNEKAARAEEKYRRELRLYLAKKEEVRARHPKPENSDTETTLDTPTDLEKEKASERDIASNTIVPERENHAERTNGFNDVLDNSLPQQSMVSTARFYLTRSGIYHAEGCIHTRAVGEWLDPDMIRSRHSAARPCGRCTPQNLEE